MSKTATYALIESQTLGSAQATVTFSSIPGTYTDLVVVWSGSTSSGNLVKMEFNGDTGANYSSTLVWGMSGAASGSSSRYSVGWQFVIPDATQQNTIFHVMDYSNTTTFKTAIGRANVASTSVGASVILWRNTNAITSASLKTSSDNFTAGSTFRLYGIQAGNA